MKAFEWNKFNKVFSTVILCIWILVFVSFILLGPFVHEWESVTEFADTLRHTLIALGCSLFYFLTSHKYLKTSGAFLTACFGLLLILFSGTIVNFIHYFIQSFILK